MAVWERDTACSKIVTLCGMQVTKKDVPLGKEFIEDGHTYQATMGPPTKFDCVPLNSTFKLGDTWCARMTPGASYSLEPNRPFGISTSNCVVVRPDQMVRILVVDRR
ncbi:MAG: hypothetical protein JWM46_104 [Candidatus Kaiserbacteria bacterium]|nr:hypothetical protein [Candidatus Kaiserbacteria bacterium]